METSYVYILENIKITSVCLGALRTSFNFFSRMNSEWQTFFSKPAAVVPRRGTGEWFCSGCLRDFGRACNAGLHLSQSSECQKTFSMIYTLKEIKTELPEEKIGDLLQEYDEEIKDEIKEGFNDTDIEVKRNTRKGRRNWNPGYIIRVYDWCIARKRESEVSRRALSRLGSDFWKVPEKTVYRWL